MTDAEGFRDQLRQLMVFPAGSPNDRELAVIVTKAAGHARYGELRREDWVRYTREAVPGATEKGRSGPLRFGGDDLSAINALLRAIMQKLQG